MKKVATLFLMFTSFFFLFPSCKDSPRIQSNDTITYAYTFHLHVPSHYYLTIKTQNSSVFSYQGKETQANNTAEIGLTYNLSKDSFGLSQLKLTYDKVKLTLESTNKEKQEFSTDNTSSPSEMNQLLSLLKGSSIFVHFDSIGKTASITGIEEVYNKALSAIPVGETAMRKAVQEQLTSFIGADFVRNTLEPVGQLFPDSAVRTGDSWTKQINQQAGLKFTSQSSFTVTSLKDSTAVIAMESTIDGSKATSMNISGYQVNTNLTGSQTGEFKTDMQTGLLKEASIRTKLDGEVQLMGRTVPLSVTIKKDVSLRKLP